MALELQQVTAQQQATLLDWASRPVSAKQLALACASACELQLESLTELMSQPASWLQPE